MAVVLPRRIERENRFAYAEARKNEARRWLGLKEKEIIFAKWKDIHPQSSILEQEVAEYLKANLPQYKFKKVRPSWLRNPKTHRLLELDFYCKELNLAIEVNGQQHYFYTPHFHESEEKFQAQVERDKLKQTICANRGVKLIIIRYDCRNLDAVFLSCLPIEKDASQSCQANSTEEEGSQSEEETA